MKTPLTPPDKQKPLTGEALLARYAHQSKLEAQQAHQEANSLCPCCQTKR